MLLTGAGSAGPHIKLAGAFTTWEIENQYAGGANNDMFRIRNTALGSDALVINRGNNRVGIGTTNPSHQLSVAGDVFLDGDNQQIFFGGTNTFVGELSNSQKLQLRGGGSNSTHTAVLDSAGRFGLATSSPQVRLHLENSDGTDEFLRFSDSAAVNVASVRAYQQYYMGNNTTRVGYFGFTTDETFDMATTTSNGTIRFLAGANQEAVRITSAGNVGIGTTDPTASLEVNGAMKGGVNVSAKSADFTLSSTDNGDFIHGTSTSFDQISISSDLGANFNCTVIHPTKDVDIVASSSMIVNGTTNGTVTLASGFQPASIVRIASNSYAVFGNLL